MTEFIIKYRWYIIGLCAAIGAGFGLLIPGARTDPEIRNYVPSSMNSRLETDKIESEFGVQDMVVILFSDSCILTEKNLLQIKEIDRDISRLKGISGRISPFTIKTIKGENGMMVAERLIQKIPVDKQGVRNLENEITRNRFVRDIVVSSDMTTASITATIDNNGSEIETLQRIDSVINAHPGNTKIITGGLPYIRQHIMSDVRKDALFLVPAALLIILIILKLTLGEWRSVMMPFSVVIISTVISMGMIPLLGWKMSIMTLLVPIILVAVANNYGIYLVARYQEISFQHKAISRYSIISELLKTLNMPILFSGLTTVAGILGLLTHSVIPARQVGVLAATGVTLALIMSLLLIPALIYLKGSRVNNPKNTEYARSLFNTLLIKLSSLIVKRPGRILIISAFVTLSLSFGIILLKIDTNQENYFPKKHPVRLASKLINSKFGGSQTISVMITGDIKSPDVMKGIDDLTLQLESENGVGKVFSISQVVREMSKAIYDTGEQGYDEIPRSTEAIAQLFELYNMSGDQADFKQIMNLDNSKAHILIRLSNPENDIITAVKNKIFSFAGSFPAQITVGGYAIIMSDFAGSIIKGQVSSLIFALVTVFILLAIIFKSLKGGLTGSIPLASSILILFGFMGVTGIALDAATALLSSIMIGVGVDFTIQYIWCLNTHLRKGLPHDEATVAAIKTIGRSIIINAVSVMAGFSVLMFSGFTSIRFFGYLVFISIGACLIGAIVVIPAFLIKFKPGFIQKDLSISKRKKYEKSSDLINVPATVYSNSGTTT
jgi:hydrophobe/amphiphile efflux-3 (HAE3) family protein